MGAIGDSLIDTTDENGGYVFKGVKPGSYNVLAVHLARRTRLLITGIEVALADTTPVPSGVLLEPGAIRLRAAGGIPLDGYGYIPGTDIAAFPANGGGEVVLDSVPAGMVPEVRFVAAGDSAAVTRSNVLVKPGDTVTIANLFWKYAQQVCLNTSTSGANVEGDALDFPVLIRLNSSNFDFNQALADGADIRFTKTDNTFLPCEIERWDAANRKAEVWVKVDTVHGNDSAQTIMMYWGNAAAANASNSAAVFDTANGFQGVWHLSEAGSAFAFDATVNHYDGTPYGMSETSATAGTIGKARHFDGVSSYITMPNTANSKLNFTQDGYYTVSAWVFADTLDNFSHLIVSKGYEQYYLRITSWNSPSPQWEFVEFNETTKWETSTFPATGRQWTLLTGVRQGSRQFLYCNGVLVDSTIEAWSNVVSRNTANDLSIGKFLQQVNVPIPGEGYDFFKGAIDEVRILSTAQNQDWVRLCYMNQRSDDRLVQFK
jgi:hypothetical protein